MIWPILEKFVGLPQPRSFRTEIFPSGLPRRTPDMYFEYLVATQDRDGIYRLSAQIGRVNRHNRNVTWGTASLNKDFNPLNLEKAIESSVPMFTRVSEGEAKSLFADYEKAKGGPSKAVTAELRGHREARAPHFSTFG